MTVDPDNGKIPLLVLVGPTAVGKSSLALKIARFLNTDIISADSAQVYRLLDIGTAKPSIEDQKLIKHHLIDIVDPDQAYSVADFQKDADNLIGQLWQSGKLPFLVGGTGLYIKAVIDRYAFGPKGANREVRSSLEQLVSSEEPDRLYNRLKAIDPVSAKKIHPNDQRRIIRALEVYASEGRPISEQLTRTASQNSPYRAIIFGMTMNRDLLYRRIELRVDKMIERGFIDEVLNLYQKGYDDHAPGMQILGYRHLLAYITENLSLEEIITEIKKQTRNLAKRQLTWFRRENNIEWLDRTDDSLFNNIAENIYMKVKDISL